MSKPALILIFVCLSAFAEHSGPYPGSDRTPWQPPTRPGTPMTSRPIWMPPKGPQPIPTAACYQRREETLKEFDDGRKCLDSLKDDNKACEQKAKDDCGKADNVAKRCTFTHTSYPGEWISCQLKNRKSVSVCEWFCTDVAPRPLPPPAPKKD